MYGREEAFKRSADFAQSASATLGAVSVATGVFLGNTACGPELAEWNIVNGVLCAALAASTRFSLLHHPKALQNAFRLTRNEISRNELVAEGLVPASVSVGVVLLPAAVLLWAVKGLFGMTIGVCAETAPLFYCLSLLTMLAQVAAVAHFAKINLEAAGVNVPKVDIRSAEEVAMKTKNIAMDLGRTGYAVASEKLVPAAQQFVASAPDAAQRVWANRPRWMSQAYWAGAEGSYLLR